MDFEFGRSLGCQDYFARLKPLPYSPHTAGEFTLIYPEELDWMEAETRGYLEGVTVQFANELRYVICFMTPIRLRQEIEADAINGRPFFAEPGLIVIADIKEDLINFAAREIARKCYFGHLKPLKPLLP